MKKRMTVRTFVKSAAIVTVFSPRFTAIGIAQDAKLDPISARAAKEQQRLNLRRFEKQVKYGGFTVGASFTGRSMLGAERSVFIRKHLVVEVLLVPEHSKGTRVSASAFRLKVNGERDARLSQAPGVVAYDARNPDLRMGPRLEAAGQVGNAGVVWDSGGRPTRAKFPGDPRAPRRLPSQDREAVRKLDAAEEDAAAIEENAFTGGVLFEPASGFLYFPCDLDLERVKKLELVFAPDEESGGQVVLRLK